MKETRHFITVGIAFLTALTAIIFGYGWLKGSLARYHTINAEFADAQGIKPGVEVRMAGVRIGSIESVRLTRDNTAMLKLRIDDGFDVPQDSQFIIATSLLGSAPSLTVIPSGKAGVIGNGETVRGAGGASIDMTLNDGRSLITSLKKTTDKLAEFSNDPSTMADLKATVRNLRKATEGLPAVQRQIQTQLVTLSRQSNNLLADVQANQQRVANRTERLIESAQRDEARLAASTNRLIGSADRNVNALGGSVKATVEENRKTIKALLANTNESVENLSGLLKYAGETIGDKKIRANLVTTTDNLAAITQKLSDTAGNIERLSGDSDIQADLKATVLNLREATANAKALTARFSNIRIPGERRPRNPDDPNPTNPAEKKTDSAIPLIENGLAVDGLYDTTAERFRLDTAYTLAIGKSSFYRVGLYDVTESNYLNLQTGQRMGDRGAIRYGILFGKLGAGLDWRIGPIDIRFDLFNPNRATLNGRLKAHIKNGFSITAGMDSLGNENRAVLGLQIRK